MKSLFSILRFALIPAAALLTVSCKNKKADANPYASDPYYGPQGGGSTYGSTGSDYPDVQPTAPPAPAYDNSGYTAPPSAPAYSGGASSGTTGGSTHTVVSGDTLFSLSRRYGTTVNSIKSANGLSSDMIRIGQTLTIP